MQRNRLDFVPRGQVAGQIAEVGILEGREHWGMRDGPDDEGNFGVEYTYTLDGVEASIRLWGHPFIYRVRVIEGEHGPQVVELHIDQPQYQPDVPLAPDDLRKLARLLDRLAHAAVGGLPAVGSHKTFNEPERRAPKRPGRHGHPDSFYAEIAELAKRAHRERKTSGTSVRRVIADTYRVSPEVANKWLARARAAGHLRAGELGGTPKPRKEST